MLINAETVDLVIDSATSIFSDGHGEFAEMLEQLPAAIYVTDKDGTIIYFNRACVTLSGREPVLGVDKWCVTWKLYTVEGERLPHDECPMAVAIQQRRQIRDVEAVAERPDGSRVNFIPYPTPVFNESGDLSGAVNLLLEVRQADKPRYLRQQAERCRSLANETGSSTLVETLMLMAAKYDEQALRMNR
ncbi:PAS domain-containing protein [Sphingomonas sp. LY54]|uniref:PAS domain-containing protein n=1 Tax=Sphingomonadales TaxID=204457 RepID=UPI002ADEACD0|nr:MULTISPECIES: PAS domain-containing protein [Sphingomonadales]MEA1015613.1 PAS domain-containing protein [Sphingosinicella sp. LY1275]WRP29498.1 PAS domain-containing protein [Sphingomonas sp. LY54]